jgi:hypothetical protein
MKHFRLIGAAALSLMLATPAMAMQHHHHYGYTHKKSGYGSIYGAYAFDRGHDFGSRNIYNDFDRRNTFN